MYFSSALYSHPQGKRMPRPGTGLVLAVCYANEGTWQGQGDKRHSLLPPPKKKENKSNKPETPQVTQWLWSWDSFCTGFGQASGGKAF